MNGAYELVNGENVVVLFNLNDTIQLAYIHRYGTTCQRVGLMRLYLHECELRKAIVVRVRDCSGKPTAQRGLAT